LCALAFTVCLLAQQPQPEVRFTASANLVVVNVGVKDRNGRPIENLKPADFEVLEDGKPQKISVFEYQRLEEPAETPPAPAAPAAAPAKGRISASAPGQVRYRDRRLLVLYFDFSAMGQPEQIRARDAALKFLDEQMTPADMVAVMAFTNRLQVIEDFTADRERLKQIINSFRIGEASELAEEGVAGEDVEEGTDTGAAFTADETEFNIFNTDRKLGALEDAVRMLASLPEKKALVYFSAGVGRTGVENQSQLRSTVNAALRGNVAFYPVDARGLMATAPAGDASRGGVRGSGIYSGQTQRSMRSRFTDQQETLYTLAADTGGKALLDENDLTVGIRQAQRDISSYYILGYYSTNPAQDGAWRRIRVRLLPQPQARLDYRSGYFAPKEFRRFDAADRERQLEDALALGDPITDLPLALEVNYFRASRNTYFIPVAVKIPGSAIKLAESGRKDETEIEFVAQVRDAKGHLAASVRDAVKVRLRGAAAERLASRNLTYDTGFTLAAGDYVLKLVCRENETGKLGTFETRFSVPDLAAPNPYLRLSSVVWSNQREKLEAAVGAVRRDRKTIRAHPLIQEGQKVIPSVTRVFRTDQNLYVYAEAYDAGRQAEAPQPSLLASLQFFREGVKAFETEPTRVRRLTGTRTPIELSVPLASLKPGRYTVQLTVVDEIGKKFAFPRATLVILDRRPAVG
jgi:VWFA-related protein